MELSREEQAAVRVFSEEYCKEEKRQSSRMGSSKGKGKRRK